MDIPENGIVLVDKPSGWSSFKAVAVVRRRLSQKLGHKAKVGHAGTLDPFATGLLILLTGKACKEAGTFLKMAKTYEVTSILGQESTTGDPEGELQTVSTQEPPEAAVKEALAKFTGPISQTPPIYSAIKVNGVRAYHLARKGQEVQMTPRQITIHQIALLEYRYPEVKFVCDVSSGTYIRSLVEDIGKVLSTGAYTSALRRTSIGEYDIQQAQQIDEEEAA
jgi:tRNA pseudouridine55 synthase